MASGPANFEVINREHYDRKYSAVRVDDLIRKVKHLDRFLHDACRTDTSWVGMYYGDFRQRLQGAQVLEVRAGDGLNALIMAALGATVVAVDISEVTPRLIGEAASVLGLARRVTALVGEFDAMPGFAPRSFDFVVGKAFLHHLTHDVEDRYLAKAASLLRPEGEARFVEPAVNSRVLDLIRWVVPVPGRPSCLQRASFARWRASDPHPARDNSSRHYLELGARYFHEAEIVPIGGIERLHRIMPGGRMNRQFRRIAFRFEALLPYAFRLKIARAQVVIFRRPRLEVTG